MCFKTKGELKVPPKQKFSKEEIVTAALEIVRKEGVDALTARRLGDELNSSSRPIFTVFRSMNELVHETVMAARALYNQYIARALTDEKPFKATGMAYIRFAMDEPKIFTLLFMKENQKAHDLSEVLKAIDENSNSILNEIKREYGLDDEKAHLIYQYLWIFTHGIATLSVTGVCSFEDEEIDKMLTDVFISILIRIKAGDI